MRARPWGVKFLPAARFVYAGIGPAAPGEQVNGDSWQVRIAGHLATLMVGDGLGHGVGAAEASDAVWNIFALGGENGAPNQTAGRIPQSICGTRRCRVLIQGLRRPISVDGGTGASGAPLALAKRSC